MGDRTDEVLAAIEQLGQDIHDYEFYNSVAELHTLPDSITWYRDFVSRNRPCVIRGGVSDWPAIHLWDLDYIQERMGAAPVTCSFTCDGRADSVQRQPDGSCRFLLPDNRQMSMQDFVRIFRQSKREQSPVPSVQFQNDNLQEFASLSRDIDVTFPWAFRAFGASQPDAVNLWIGDKRSATTYHKDHYENVYAVISGCKTFTLRPPSSLPYMHLQLCPVYQQTMLPDETFSFADQHNLVRWCPVDVEAIQQGDSKLQQQRQLYPRYFNGPKPLQVTVNAGDVLYLPAMWYHYVQQDELEGEAVIAVNCWVDMEFDARFAWLKLLERLCEGHGLVDRQPGGPAGSDVVGGP
eukprot:jgi/Ulvmu1/11423/UM075_0089.1